MLTEAEGALEVDEDGARKPDVGVADTPEPLGNALDEAATPVEEGSVEPEPFPTLLVLPGLTELAGWLNVGAEGDALDDAAALAEAVAELVEEGTTEPEPLPEMLAPPCLAALPKLAIWLDAGAGLL